MEPIKTHAIYKTLAKFVSLNVFGMIGLSCYILADTYFISNGVGINGLTALNLALPIYSVIHGAGLMIGIGGGTKYSVLQAQKKSKEANQVFSQALSFGLLIGLLLFLIGLLFSKPLTSLLGADKDTFTYTNTYLKTILCFSPFFILNNVLIAFIRNDGEPRIPMAGMVIGSLSNIVLDYIFIFPLNMGMFGAAFATGLAPIISISILFSYFFKKKNHLSFQRTKQKMTYIKSICSLGISSLIGELSSGMVMLIFNMVILSLEGNKGVAAYGIIANLALVVVSVYNGIAQGIQPVISSNYGSKNEKNVKISLRFGILLSIICSLCIYGFTVAFPHWLVSIFNQEKDMELAALASKGLILYFTAFLFVGINVITASYFSSTERSIQGFIISICKGFFLIIPLVFLLSNWLGITGVWLSYPLAEMITALIGLVLICRKKS